MCKNITTDLLVSEGDYAHIANGAQALESGRFRLKSWFCHLINMWPRCAI